ncbi:MAG TPA: SpoIIE family protein phosphatase, partial [Magnetospirillaceae bacterium]|nr:SpoIIE family protein phosphatase [Magnetospirillaceae bacterium]
MSETIVEVGHFQVRKAGQAGEGDVFLSRKTEGGRIVSVLSDGLGSGVKAGVLATLTATMAVKFVADDIPIQRAAGIIMKTLPLCKVRKISYATFTIADVEHSGTVRILEYDNPPYLLIRDGQTPEPPKTCIMIQRSQTSEGGPAEVALRYSEFEAVPGDRLLLWSDGVIQSGMGSKTMPLGWGLSAAVECALGLVEREPSISARELAHRVVLEALRNDAYKAKDDISCGVLYLRQPRRLLVLTGPPVDRGRDKQMAREFSGFKGRKIVAGGTTASILSRELGRHLRLRLDGMEAGVPPSADMEGADLVTEGIITLGKAAEVLERPDCGGRPTQGA